MEWEGAVTVFLPSKTDASRLADVLARPDYTADDIHVTLTYLGGQFVRDSAVETNRAEVQRMAKRIKPFDAKIAGTGYLGQDDAVVAFLESQELVDAHDRLTPLAPPSKFPNYVPHVTLGYEGSVDMVHSRLPTTITLAYLAVLHKDDQYTYALTG